MKHDEIVSAEDVQILAERVAGAAANRDEATASLNARRAELDQAAATKQSIRERSAFLAEQSREARAQFYQAVTSGSDHAAKLAEKALSLSNLSAMTSEAATRFSIYEVNSARRAVAAAELDESRMNKALATLTADHHRATVLEKMRPVIELEGSIELNGLGQVSRELDTAVERHRQLVNGLTEQLKSLDASIATEREDFERRKAVR